MIKDSLSMAITQYDVLQYDIFCRFMDVKFLIFSIRTVSVAYQMLKML